MSSTKRENSNIILTSQNIILDIEGTTTSITFVKDVLFPYVRKHLETFVKENWDSDAFQAILNALRNQANEDKEKKLDGVIDIPENGEKEELVQAVIQNVLWQMDLDSKAKSLKDLQGLIMEIGYNKGELKGHVYEDFEPNLKLWTELGKNVYIYSSGSVHAQKLLYGHSEKGDLLPYIKGHFDTTVGKKGEAESYKKILEQISSSPSETVFFTDIPKEAKAAKEAGLSAILLFREGNAPLTEEDKEEFQVIKSFSEIQFENNSKKRKICTESDSKNGNKLVESCEVSLEPLKEPTHSTLIQQQDVNMEVEESCNEETNCNTDDSDEKKAVNESSHAKNTKHNESGENGDSKIKPATNVEEKNESANEKNATEVLSEELPQKEIVPEELKSENKAQNNVLEEQPSKSVEKCEEKVESINGSSELDNPADTTSVSSNDQKNKETTCQEEIREPSQKNTSENETKQDQTNSNPEVQPNGDPTQNSVNEPENKSDIEVAMDKSSEKQNNKLNLDPEVIEEKHQCQIEKINGASLHTNESSQIGDKKLPELEQVISKEAGPSENDMDVDDKPCHVINSDCDKSDLAPPKDGSGPMDMTDDTEKPNKNVLENKNSLEVSGNGPVNDSSALSTDLTLTTTPPSPKDVSPMADADKPNETVVENASNEIENEPVNKSPISNGADNTGHAVQEAIKEDKAITEKKQSDTPNGEEITSESNKETESEVNAAKSDDIDSNLKPCVDMNADKTLLETPSKIQNVDKPDSDQAKSGNMEVDKENVQKCEEVKEVCEENKSANGESSRSPKDTQLNCTVSNSNTNAKLEEKSLLINSAETQNQPDINESSQKTSPEPCIKEKTESVDEYDCRLNTNESLDAADVKNGVNDEEGHLNGKDETQPNQDTKTTVNGKVGESSKPVEGDDDHELKKKIDDNPVCEVKKFEVPENTVITAVVEA